jgi:hypothetical protein
MENSEVYRLKDKIVEITSDLPLVSDFMAKLVITFGIVLLVSGLALMLSDSSLVSEVALADSAIDSAVGVISWVPGVPFNARELVGFNVTTAGLVSWVVGIDLLLIGLGVWIRYRIAHLAAVVMFSLAAAFQCQQFITLGITGAPSSITGISINVIIAYYLFAAFNCERYLNANKPLNIQKSSTAS